MNNPQTLLIITVVGIVGAAAVLTYNVYSNHTRNVWLAGKKNQSITIAE